MQSYNDRWERTKRYLLRNFLVKPGFQLSPIREEERSRSSSPESLPELVVEREVDRHDHQPEFYEGLERRMRRYYRQLFLDESDHEDSIDFEINQSMASTFILNNNAGENTATVKHVTGQINDDFDKDRNKYKAIPELVKEKSIYPDTNEPVHFEVNNSLKERSFDSGNDEDELEANEIVKFGTHSDKDQSEANSAATEENYVDYDKMSTAEDTASQENNADLNEDEDSFEGDYVITEKEQVDSHEDVSKTEGIITERKSGDIGTNKEEFEANNVVTEENRVDYNKDEDIVEEDVVATNETRYSYDENECTSEENLSVPIEHTARSDRVRVLTEVSEVRVGKLIDYDIDEIESTVNKNQYTNTAHLDTRYIELPINFAATRQKDHTSIDYSTESSNIEEVERPKVIESRSGYFMVSDIDWNENTAHDDLIHSSQVVSNQGDATILSYDCSALNMRLETIDDDLSKSKSIPDSEDSGPCHIISSTVAEVHEARPAMMRKLEDVSPVLMPKFVRVSRGVSLPDDVMKEDTLSLNCGFEISDEIMEKASSGNEIETNKNEGDKEGTETEVERLLSVSEVTNVTHTSKSINIRISKDSENEAQEDADESNEYIQEQTRPCYSKPQTDDEESIGSNEFHYTTLDPKVTEMGENESDWDSNETDINSFEIALRRGIFERKNTQRSNIPSSDEDMDTTGEDFEPVEQMRAPREFGIRDSLHRASVGTLDSPVLAFERQASADKLEDVSSDSNEIRASLDHESERKSSKDPFYTPPLHQANGIPALDDIWSVSPMELDIEQLLKETAPNKKRKLETDAEDEPIKRKNRNDIAVQTALNKNQCWEDIKTNFFVGKPLVLRLCGCADHVCAKTTSQTG